MFKAETMKRIFLIFSALFLVYGPLLSQSCLPEGITFTTQEEIDSFQVNFPGCTMIEGNTEISGENINNLNGLMVLNSLGGDLILVQNPLLSSLDGLNNITAIGGKLAIQANDSLLSLAGLQSLNFIAGPLVITHNHSLYNLSGLDSIHAIEEYLSISINNSLVDFTGLNNVKQIRQRVYISNNNSLINLIGLNSLISTGGNFTITNNATLESLDGLENLTTIKGEFRIGDPWIGGNFALTSLNSLINLTVIEGDLAIMANFSITSLEGLNNIVEGSIQDLYIFYNSSLEYCEIQSICDYLVSPNGLIDIHSNATGCNTQEEIEDACIVPIQNTENETNILFWPNPASTQLLIECRSGQTIDEVIIYNQTGQIVLHQEPTNKSIDISHLHPGMYFVEVVVDEKRIRKKVIIE